MKDYERVYLEQKRGEMSVEDIAKELGKSVNTIKKWLKELPEVAQVPAPVKKKRTKPLVHELYAKVKQKGKPVGVVMSEAASMSGDDFRAKTKFGHDRFEPNIHKMFDED